MRSIFASCLAMLALAACQTTGEFDAGSRSSHAVLVMAEDADTGSIARTNNVTRRVIKEISGQVSDYGFSVFDEAALTLNSHKQGRARRSDTELIDVARSITRPRIDTIALFSVFSDSQIRPHTRKLRVRLTARLLDAQSGRHFGNLEVSDIDNIHSRCDGPCYTEAVGDIARVLGREVADILAQKLDVRFTRPVRNADSEGLVRGLTLTFENFGAVEMQDIEAYLPIFFGYRSHRPITSYYRHREIWYESSIKHVKLKRNLDRMLSELGMQARIAFQGNQYTIRQSRIPSRARRKAPSYRW